MTYDLFRDPSGAVYERLNNYALVHIPDPGFLEKYYGKSPVITDVSDIWSVGWIAEDPRPIKKSVEDLSARVSLIEKDNKKLSDLNTEANIAREKLFKESEQYQMEYAEQLKENERLEKLLDTKCPDKIQPDHIVAPGKKLSLLETIINWFKEKND